MLGVRGGPLGSVGRLIGLLAELVRLVDQWLIVRLTIGVLVEVYCIVIVTCKIGYFSIV